MIKLYLVKDQNGFLALYEGFEKGNLVTIHTRKGTKTFDINSVLEYKNETNKELYKILDTEDTRDFSKSLINMVFSGAENENGFIVLDTCDGELLYKANEVKRVR